MWAHGALGYVSKDSYFKAYGLFLGLLSFRPRVTGLKADGDTASCSYEKQEVRHPKCGT